MTQLAIAPAFLCSGLSVLSLLSGCSGADQPAKQAPACVPANDPRVLAAAHLTNAYPDDKFGIRATEQADIIQIVGTLDANTYAGLSLIFAPCVDTAPYSGLSFRISGYDSSRLGRLLVLPGDLEDTSQTYGGTCRPLSDATVLTDCASTHVSVDFSGPSTAQHFRWTDFSDGHPNYSLSEPKLLSITWAFGAEPESAPVAFTIDQIEFF